MATFGYIFFTVLAIAVVAGCVFLYALWRRKRQQHATGDAIPAELTPER